MFSTLGTGSPESLLVKSQYLLTAKVKHSALTADLLGVSLSSHYNKRSSVSQNSCFLTAILLFCDVLMDSAFKNDDTTNNSNSDVSRNFSLFVVCLSYSLLEQGCKELSNKPYFVKIGAV